MLRGEFGGKRWRVFWVFPDGKVGHLTHCCVELDETPFWGSARRNPVDRPDPEAARRLSLTRALMGEDLEAEPAFFPTLEENKAFRTEVWKAYLGRKTPLTKEEEGK